MFALNIIHDTSKYMFAIREEVPKRPQIYCFLAFLLNKPHLFLNDMLQ